MKRPPWTLLLLALAGFAPAKAQEALMILEGPNEESYFGSGEIDFAGDVNGDGYDDIVTGLYNWQNLDEIFFQVFSGLDGSLIHSWRFGGGISYAHAHSCSAAGDMDGDGYDDVVLGGSDGSDHFVEVRSGGAGVLIHRWTSSFPVYLGIEVRGGGDLDGDGVPDVLACEDDAYSGSKVNAYSGATGQVLYVLDRYSNPNEWSWAFGRALDFLGDINGDGCDDFVVGDVESSLGGTRFGAAFVFSGSDGAVLYKFPGPQKYSDYGGAVAGPGDMNGDGVPDISIGARGYNGVAIYSGLVDVFSGADGSRLYQFFGDQYTGIFGDKLSRAGDVNKDGFADLVIMGGGSQATLEYFCRVYSGLDGSVLTTQQESIFDSYGRSIAGGGDLNGDGFPDFAVSAPDANNYTGRIYIYPGNPVLKIDPPTAGQRTDFQVMHFANDKHVRLAYSTLGWGVTSVPQLGLNLDILNPVLAAGPTATDLLGQLTWDLKVPAGTSGITIWMQAAQYGLKTNVVSQTIQ
jgi:FG-GAP repeat protein/VCBS repeat protein